jgi:HK97 family phage major capsid protein
MPVEDSVLDPEIVAEMRGILAEHLDRRFAEFDTKTERRMKELSARGVGALVGAGGATGTRAMPLLNGDQKFNDWVRGGRGRSARYAANYSNFRLEQKATIMSPSVALPATVPGISGPPEVSLRLVELLPTVALASGGAVEYARENSFVPGADIQVEGAAKAATDIQFAPATASIKTIATTLKASLQALSDQPSLGQWLDSRLRYAVQLRAEDYLLTDATDGLLAAAGTPDPLYAPTTGATALDVVGSAIAQLSAAGFTPDGVVMSGSDVAKMRMLKNSTGDYLWARPSSSLGTAAVWSVPLIVSPSMAAGSFLVGAFGQSTVLFTRRLLIVEIAYENEDDFIRNLACLRAEERIGLAIPIPVGLIKGTFAPPAALTARK